MMQITSDLFIAAAVFMIIIVILYLVGTVAYTVDYTDESITILAAEILLLFAGIMYLTAAVYLRIRSVDHKETYAVILEENYKAEKSGAARDCCAMGCTGNTYLVVGWLVFIGTVPLILYPVPIFPFIMVFVVLFIVLFIVASSPIYLAMNDGKGSLVYCTKGQSNGCCGTCESRSFSSDVVVILLTFVMFGVFFVCAAAFNVYATDGYSATGC
jgi:hypothetical protein